MDFIGIDLDKTSSQVCILSGGAERDARFKESGGRLAHNFFATSGAEAIQFFGATLQSCPSASSVTT